MGFATALSVFVIALGAALAALTILGVAQRRSGLAARSVFDDRDGGTVFLFDGTSLVDATEAARALLGSVAVRGSAWARLQSYLAPHFPGFEAALADLPKAGRIRLDGTGSDPVTLLAEWRGGLMRLTLCDPHSEARVLALDALSQRAQDEELASLRAIADSAPLPIWRTGAGGVILWANAAYADLVARKMGEEEALGWPLPALFEGAAGRGRACLRIEAGPKGRAEGTTDVWVDLHAFPAGAGEIVFALPADAAVRAEGNMRAFLLTLTRAFAHLPIGLAIFDPQRRLQLFNPALSDLTQLSPEFLSGRPTLYAVFDAMRDRRMVPEPRDYKGWRQRIAALETTPDAGDMQETWLLPGGTPYRMTARPQADGALALLIEDITDEMARSRTDRASLEVSQSVIDALDEAIAVFDQDGRRIMSNAAFAALWGEGPEMAQPQADLQALLGLWQAGCAPDPVWPRIGAFVAATGERQGWTAELRLLDGRALGLRVVGLRGGATLIGFDARRGAPAIAQRPPRRAAALRDRATGTG
ncbi:MAG: PAS domain-containing protein [Gemmobacter sp.]